MRKFIGSEFKVIALVAVGLLLGEGAIRSSERWLSIDLTHLKSLDRLAKQAARPGSDGELQILFLGNSMTRYGVNPDVFVKAADDRTHLPLTVTKINPDATKIADWYYLYRNFFHEKGRKPDLLIIGFQGDQLSDQPTQHINRLARFYDCRSDDWSDLTRWDLRTFEDVCSYAASCVSGLHGNRDRFDRRVLDLVVPHYREAVARINTVQRQGNSPLPVAMSALPEPSSVSSSSISVSAALRWMRAWRFIVVTRSSSKFQPTAILPRGDRRQMVRLCRLQRSGRASNQPKSTVSTPRPRA